MHVGFTGTQRGLTNAQRVRLKRLIRTLAPRTVHHGDCVGADVAFHHITRVIGNIRVVVHPPLNDYKRAFCQGDATRVPKGYLTRNRDIVNGSTILIACPGEQEEQQRSGTWATVRYARKQGKPIYLIYPDGSVAQENRR